MKKKELTELQKKHQQEIREKRESLVRRKQRTHRLVVRGVIAENFLKYVVGHSVEKMTDSEFQDALWSVFRNC